MRSFEVPALQPLEFVDAIRVRLAAKEFDRYVFVDLNGSSLAVELRWMGTTRFDFRISEIGEGFRAELISQRVAPLHSAFSERFESYFEEALTKVGATAV